MALRNYHQKDRGEKKIQDRIKYVGKTIDKLGSGKLGELEYSFSYRESKAYCKVLKKVCKGAGLVLLLEQVENLEERLKKL